MKIIETMLNSLGMILFCLGIIFLIHGSKQSELLFSKVQESREEQIVYKGNQEPEELCTSYGQLIAMLFSELDYDIQIDDLNISKAEHIGLDCNNYNIKNTNYLKSYVYDTRGNIIKIVYKSLD